MRKVILCFILSIICLSLSINANTVVFEDNFNDGDMGDFSTYFSVFAPNENFVSQDDNGYFHGKWINGAYAIYMDELEDYTLYADFKIPVGIVEDCNYTRSAIFLRNSVESKEKTLEPDNGDNDKSSYLGGSGIYFYCYGNTLEVGIHTTKANGTTGPVNEGVGVKVSVPDASARLLGSYTTTCILNLPEGKSFDNFIKVKIVDAKDKISFYAEDTLVCELGLSNLGDVKTVIGEGYFKPEEVGSSVFEEKSYKTIVVKDASGTEVMKVEDAVVSAAGYFGFTSRGSQYMVDNVKVEYNYEVTPEPTKETTSTPDTTPTTKPTATKDSSTSDKGGNSSNTITYILIGAAVVLVGGIVFLVFKMKKTAK